MQPIKLVVFDWNGVLIADTRGCLEADNYVLKAFGGKPVSLKVYRDTIIIPSLTFYTMHGADEKELRSNTEKWGRIFHDYYGRRVSKVRSRKGVRKLLKWLGKNNIKSIIMSNHLLDDIKLQLKRLKL